MRVLLIEDDLMIGEAINQSLKEAAYTVDWVRNGQTAIDTLHIQHYDIALLDLGLPGKSGMEVLSALRAEGNEIPVLIVTAQDALDSRVGGLDLGADDYILKPFDMAELLARMRAVTRRRQGASSPELTNGDLSLNPATHEVTRNGATQLLSAKEYALLHALLIRPGAILSRASLEDRLYGWNEEVVSNAVEFLIYSLRKKLGSDVIRNVRGVGWMVSKEK
jgi:two-component system OmpR family response regulator